MAFASAFMCPASSRFIRPGSASLWCPPRPFPVLLWLAERRRPHTSPAGTEASATSPALPRLEMELRLLFSRFALAPDDNFFVALHIELGRRAWSLEHAIGAPRPADPSWPTVRGAESNLDKLRARLVAEVNLGLAMVETAPVRFSRPVRNVLLARHAGHIGRCLHDLLSQPGAGSLAHELTSLLDALQRRR